jgi:hypothetical protein
MATDQIEGKIETEATCFRANVPLLRASSGVSRKVLCDLSEGAIKLSQLNKVLAPNSKVREIPSTWVPAACRILKVPASAILGPRPGDSDLFRWEVCEYPEYGEGFWNLAKGFQHDVDHLIGWGSVLPCSLVPPDFMKAHHKRLAEVYYTSEKKRERFRSVYDQHGLTRHETFRALRGFGPGASAPRKRPWQFVHIMFRADLEAILQGKGDYRYVRKELRRQCARELLSLMKAPSANVELAVVGPAKQSEADALRVELGVGTDSVVVIARGEDEAPGLLFMREIGGDLFWSIKPARVREYRDTLRKLWGLARDTPQVAEGLLRTYARTGARG